MLIYNILLLGRIPRSQIAQCYLCLKMRQSVPTQETASHESDNFEMGGCRHHFNLTSYCDGIPCGVK